MKCHALLPRFSLFLTRIAGAIFIASRNFGAIRHALLQTIMFLCRGEALVIRQSIFSLICGGVYESDSGQQVSVMLDRLPHVLAIWHIFGYPSKQPFWGSKEGKDWTDKWFIHGEEYVCFYGAINGVGDCEIVTRRQHCSRVDNRLMGSRLYTYIG